MYCTLGCQLFLQILDFGGRSRYLLILGVNLTFDALPGVNSGSNIILQNNILLELFLYEKEVLCHGGMGYGEAIKVLVEVLQICTRNVRYSLGCNKNLH